MEAITLSPEEIKKYPETKSLLEILRDETRRLLRKREGHQISAIETYEWTNRAIRKFNAAIAKIIPGKAL